MYSKSLFSDATASRSSDREHTREHCPLVADIMMFCIKQMRAGLFALLFFGILAISRYFTFGLARYDFLFVAALLSQVVLIGYKYETMSEARAILLFHVLGFMLEVFKTHPSVGSWFYPEFGYAKLCGVPLYAGFMYASVGSYMMRAWKELDLALIDPPRRSRAILLAFLVYVNFFSHHFVIDVRYILIACILYVFRHTHIRFRAVYKERALPFAFSFLCLGVIIWLAENVATYFGAWQYPHQSEGWRLVHIQKVISWSLLATISFIIVASRDRVWRGIKIRQ